MATRIDVVNGYVMVTMPGADQAVYELRDPETGEVLHTAGDANECIILSGALNAVRDSIASVADPRHVADLFVATITAQMQARQNVAEPVPQMITRPQVPATNTAE